MNMTALNKNSQEQYSTNILFVANAIFCVIRDFLQNTAPSLVLTTSCRRTSSSNFYHDVLTLLLRKWDKMEKSLQILEVGKSSQQSFMGPRILNLILIDSYQAFLDVDIVSHTRMNNFNEFNYIILEISNDLMEAQLQQILEYCWSNYIIHCSVQVGNALDELFVYTYFPFTANHCANVEPVLINQYNGTAFVESQLFPKKLKNFYGCPLRVATWNLPPFMYFFKHDNETSISGGIEGKLLHTLAASLNFTIELKIAPYKDEHGIVFSNRAAIALLMLQNLSADLSFGGYSHSIDRDKVVSATMSYYQSKQVFTALHAAYDLTSWQILTYPFNICSWLLIIFTFVVALLNIALVKRINKQFSKLFVQYPPKYSYLNVFATCFGMPALSMPKYTNGRILFINWLCFTLIIRTVYQALLFHLIRTHVENRLPETVDDIINSKFTLVMTQRTYAELQDLPILQMPKLVVMLPNDTSALAYFEQLNSKQHIFLAPQEYVMLYKPHESGAFRTLPTYLLAFPITMYLTKHSFLADQFNEELLRIRVAGFFDLWKRWEFGDKIVEEDSHKEGKMFSLMELYMVFVLHGVGLLVSYIVFILELMAKRINILKNIFNKI